MRVLCTATSIIIPVLLATIGCGDIAPRPGVTITRNGNSAVLQCEATGETWTATCQGQVWVEQRAPECSALSTRNGMSKFNVVQSGIDKVT